MVHGAVMRPLALAVLALATAACTGGLTLPVIAQDLGPALTAPMAPRAPRVGRDVRDDISAADPARLLVIGDSLGQGFGLLLREEAAARGLPMVVSNEARASTGLARADFYDWPKAFADMAPYFAPDIVVAHFGANDMQAIIERDRRTAVGADTYDAVYTERIYAILRTAADQGAVVYLLGPATDSHPNLNAHLARLNPLFAAAAAASGAHFVPLRSFTSGPEGQFAETVDVGGTLTRIRTSDGSHFNATGYRLVADRVLDDIEARFAAIVPGPGPGAQATVASVVSRRAEGLGGLAGFALQ